MQQKKNGIQLLNGKFYLTFLNIFKKRSSNNKRKINKNNDLTRNRIRTYHCILISSSQFKWRIDEKKFPIFSPFPLSKLVKYRWIFWLLYNTTYLLTYYVAAAAHYYERIRRATTKRSALLLLYFLI